MHKNNNRKERTMNNKRFNFDFFRFDGEGGAEGTASADAQGQMQEEVKPSVQYGRAPEGEASPSHVGYDNNEAPDLNAEFASLIGKGGRFHDQYGQAVSAVIQDRFKNQQNLQAQVDSITDGLSPLFLTYGLEAGDYEGLTQAIQNDDSFYEKQAERAGLSIEQYKENLRLKAEAERGRQITEAYEEQQRRNALYSQWEADTEQLRQTFPNFDLGLEIRSNERFAQLLDNGVSVQDAFYATHVGELYRGIDAEAETRATANVVNAMQTKARRPIEGGVSHVAAVERRSNPSALSNEDLDEINRRVAEGEEIAF